MKSIAIVALLFLSGCTSIHFDNGNALAGQPTFEKWHHNFGAALYEGSDPVNLKEECQGKEWNSVKTELTFMNGLASGFLNLIAPVWYPKTVEISCK